MNHSLLKTTRKDKIKGWLAEHGLSYRKMGRDMGMSDVAVRKSLLQDSVPLERYKEFRRFGLPKSLLPKINFDKAARNGVDQNRGCSACAHYDTDACDDCNDSQVNFMPQVADEPSRELAKI